MHESMSWGMVDAAWEMMLAGINYSDWHEYGPGWEYA
jgi:hypothetical protein